MHNFRAYFVFTVFFLMFKAVLLHGNTYYVAPWGNDENPGDKDAPLKTIQKGADILEAADTLVIRDGVYRISKEIRPANSGIPGKWITYYVLPGEKAVIDAENFVAGDEEGTYPSRLGLGSFHIQEKSYIRVVGLHVRNSRSAGFIVRGPSEHVQLINCKTDRSFNSGIGIWYANQVKVLRCEVTRANEPGMRVDGQPFGREAPHEAISICGATNFEVAYNHVHQCFKEGIDVKEVSTNGVVHHNHIHDLPRQGLYVDAWFGLLENVTFHSNVVHDCEWGFAISVEGKDSELKGIDFHHNLLFDNRASGIVFGVWGHDRIRSDIRIFNNTICHNGTPGHWAGVTGGIDIKSKNMQDVEIFHNIVYNNWGYEIGTSFHQDSVQQKLAEKNVLIKENITGPFKSKTTDFSFFEIDMFGYENSLMIIADPHFTDPERGDYSVSFDSPAAGNYARDPLSKESFYFGALAPGQRGWLVKY